MSLQKTTMVTAEQALPGRNTPILKPDALHFLHQRALLNSFPAGSESVLFGMGCFWGAEKQFWSCPGVWVTSVGYSGGFTPNPTYEEVCSGLTGHNEVVQVVYEPSEIEFNTLLAIFWQAHDPTQGMRQGNDIGTQYRSGIYTTTSSQYDQAMQSCKRYQGALSTAGLGSITTEILMAGKFFPAEDWHQQYLLQNPNGYCGLGGSGIQFPV